MKNLTFLSNLPPSLALISSFAFSWLSSSVIFSLIWFFSSVSACTVFSSLCEEVGKKYCQKMTN